MVERKSKDPNCTCLTELECDAYEPGGPMSGKPRPPRCLVHYPPTPNEDPLVSSENTKLEMTTENYRCVVGHMMYWKRGIKEALSDANLAHLDTAMVIERLFKAGYDYDEDTDKLTYTR